jgi:hypothetical protein
VSLGAKITLAVRTLEHTPIQQQLATDHSWSVDGLLKAYVLQFWVGPGR